MDYELWQKMPEIERAKVRDLSDLSPQLCGYEGARVEVVDKWGQKRRFWVGRSTGWKPCHLEVKTIRSLGGVQAAKDYQSVCVIRYR